MGKTTTDKRADATALNEAVDSLRTLPDTARDAIMSAGAEIATALDAPRTVAYTVMSALRVALNAMTDGKMETSARKVAPIVRAAVLASRAASLGAPDTDPRVTRGASEASIRRYLTALALIDDAGAPLNAHTASDAYAAVDAGIVAAVRDAVATKRASNDYADSPQGHADALSDAVDECAEVARTTGEKKKSGEKKKTGDVETLTPADALAALQAVADYIGNLDTVPAEYDDSVRAIVATLSGRLDTRAAQRDAEATAESDAQRRAAGGRAPSPGPAKVNRAKVAAR